MNKIYIVRHGETQLNHEEKIRGWINVDLDENGLKQAHELGKELKGKDIQGIFTSDLNRARETARIISDETGVPIILTSKDFRPWHLGIYEGESSKDSLSELQDLIKNRPNEKVPQGESFNDFKNRFLGAINELIKKYDGNYIIVAHHRNERLVSAWIKAGRDNDNVDVNEMMKKGIEPGTFDEYDISDKKIYNIDSNLKKLLSNFVHLNSPALKCFLSKEKPNDKDTEHLIQQIQNER